MSTSIQSIRAFLRRLRNDSAPLTLVVWLMMLDAVFTALGMAVDSRLVTGAPVWLKPFKFAISTGIFVATLAWLCRYIPARSAFFSACAWIIAIGLIIEIALLDLQAWRGTSSHFNIATTFDAVIFAIMGTIIALIWLASVGFAAVLFRQRFADAAWGWSLRLGLTISLIGAASGALMTAPTKDQVQGMSQHQRPVAVGAHTVGAPDGGLGIPGVGWSLEHGDLRVPHFFGLHAMQVIPFLVWILRRRNRRGLPFALAASYLALMAILTWQAYRGQSVIHPDGATLGAFLIWFAATAIALAMPERIRTRTEVRI